MVRWPTAQQTVAPDTKVWTAADDHQNMMDQLGIKALRPGPSGNEQAPNHANYDEATANPFPILPEVLTLKNGVPIGYVLISAINASSEIAYNVFETWRGGETRRDECQERDELERGRDLLETAADAQAGELQGGEEHERTGRTEGRALRAVGRAGSDLSGHDERDYCAALPGLLRGRPAVYPGDG